MNETENIASEEPKTISFKEHKSILAKYESTLKTNKQDLESLKFQLANLQRMIFGSKSERFVPSDDNQISMFAQEAIEEAIETEKLTQEISYTRKKKKRQKPIRVKLPSHLPRIEEIIEPENIADGAKKIGEEITELLEYTPSKLYVRKIIRPKYASPEQQGIVIAELPSLPIPKGNAGSSLLAHIMVSKYVDHLPFYRQIQMLARQNFKLSDSTIGGWFSATATLLEPLYNVLEKQLLESDYLQADESPMGVQESKTKGSLHRGYQWVYRSPMKGLVLFKYDESRSRKAAEATLKTFSGKLQTDGYKVYQGLKVQGPIELLGCWAHARRYFDKSLENDKVRSEYVLLQIQRLYAIERNARERNIDHETKRRYRKLYAKPILTALKTWLDNNINIVLPKSLIGKAIAYTLNLWPMLVRYIEDGRYEIDNNLIENTIRPLALGRKNYLFAGSHQAAQKAAMMYSFFATCKINDVNPQEWLHDVLDRISDHQANKLTQLLPQNWKK